MNKRAFLTLSLLALFVTAGCVSIPEGYTPAAPLQRNDSLHRYDVTYSLAYDSDGDTSMGRASEARLREMIGDQLVESNFFSSVMYKDLKEKSSYHIHFKAHYSMCSEGESVAQGLLIGYTLGLIPSWQNMYLDLSAMTFLNGQKIDSISTAENLVCYIWLPLAPMGLVWNNYLAWTDVENNCLNYLINHLTQAQQNLDKPTPWKRQNTVQTAPTKNAH